MMINHITKKGIMLLLIIIAMLVTGIKARGEVTITSVPALINYQVRLADSLGLNVDGKISVSVMIYDSETLGVPGDLNDEHLIYAEEHSEVNVNRGIMRMEIGGGMPFGRFSGAPLPLEKMSISSDVYLELVINSERMQPRQKLTFNSHSLLAKYSKKAHKLTRPINVTPESVPNLSTSKVSGTISPARIPQLSSGYLSGTVSASTIPSNISLSNITGGTVSTGLLPEIPAINIEGGSFDAAQLPDNLMVLDDVGISMSQGEVMDEDVIPIPQGFTVDECHWMISVNNLVHPVRGIDQLWVYTGRPEQTDINPAYHFPGVRCRVQTEAIEGDGLLIKPCGVHYIMLCIHN